MKIKIDLHVHSNHSNDSFISFEAINRRCLEEGLDGYAITDHDKTDGVKEAIEKKGDLIVIPGIEISARGAHILCLGPSETITRNLSIEETIERIHCQGALAILAHPYGFPRNFVKIREVKRCNIDAIEVANSSQIPFKIIMNYNMNLALKLKKPMTGGSDAHIPKVIGRSYTIIDTSSIQIEDILKAIKLGRTEVVGEGTPIIARIEKIFMQMEKILR